jgi:hypothetical protein
MTEPLMTLNRYRLLNGSSNSQYRCMGNDRLGYLVEPICPNGNVWFVPGCEPGFRPGQR